MKLWDLTVFDPGGSGEVLHVYYGVADQQMPGYRELALDEWFSEMVEVTPHDKANMDLLEIPAFLRRKPVPLGKLLMQEVAS